MKAGNHLHSDVRVQFLRRLRSCLLPRGDISLSLDYQAHARLEILRAVWVRLQCVVHRHICHGLVAGVRFRLVKTRVRNHGLVKLTGASTLPKMED